MPVNIGPPPALWADPRSIADPFAHPLALEVFTAGAWQVSAEGLRKISKPWQPGGEDDKTSVSGLIRLTFSQGGLWVLLGRGRGKTSQITIDGQQFYPTWLGLDSVPSYQGLTPKGWHPFVIEQQLGAAAVEIDLKSFKLSALSGRPFFRP